MTAYEMRISDWSSDVCSSDLVGYVIDPDNEYPANYTGHIRAELTDGRVVEERQGQLRGGTREPMSRDDLLAKARANLAFAGRPEGAAAADRKRTRLNSSH